MPEEEDMFQIPHGLYLFYHHFDFLLLDFPIYHAIMLVIALLVLWKQCRIERRLNEIGLKLGIGPSRASKFFSKIFRKKAL